MFSSALSLCIALPHDLLLHLLVGFFVYLLLWQIIFLNTVVLKSYSFYFCTFTGQFLERHGMWAVHSVVLLPIPVSLIALTILIMPTYPGVMVKIKLDFKCFAVRDWLFLKNKIKNLVAWSFLRSLWDQKQKINFVWPECSVIMYVYKNMFKIISWSLLCKVCFCL